MVHCLAPGCSNQSNNNNNVSYHKLPKNEITKNAWIHFIGRKELPKGGAICEEHFTEDCFDPSHDLKLKLMPGSTRIKRKLITNAIPTIFKHRSKPESRRTSIERRKKLENVKVVQELLNEGSQQVQVEELKTKDASTQTENDISSKFDKSTSTFSLLKCIQRSKKLQARPQARAFGVQVGLRGETNKNRNPIVTTEDESDSDFSDENSVHSDNDIQSTHSNDDSVPKHSDSDEEMEPPQNQINEPVSDSSFISEDDTANDTHDPDFQPEDSDVTSDNEEEPSTSRSTQPIIYEEERCFLVYESKLKELLKFCPKCRSPISESQEYKNTGSQLSIELSCLQGCSFVWNSQPKVGTLHGLGNLFLTSCITFTGIPFNKFERFAWLLNLKFFSDSTFYQLRKDFVTPVVHKSWEEERERMVTEITEKNIVILAGDGRCDSPGHSAKYCTYTFLDAETGKVVDTTVVPVTEVANSNAMEKEGFIRVLRRIQSNSVKVDIVSTDRHVQIRKLLRVDPEFNHIKHEFDPWHISKSLVKKLNKAAKKKGCEDLLPWIPSVINHFWWSLDSSLKSAEEMYERFRSVIFHVVDKHSWPGCTHFTQCEHDPLPEEEQREWLEEGSDSHEALKSVVLHRDLKKDLAQVTESIKTSDVEVFNNLILKYAPKQHHYEFEQMLTASYLAALDNNYNAERRQAKIKSGENIGKFRYKIAWRKATKKFTVRKVLEKKDYTYLKSMLGKTCLAAKSKNKVATRKRIMAPLERLPKEELIELAEKYRRFLR